MSCHGDRWTICPWVRHTALAWAPSPDQSPCLQESFWRGGIGAWPQIGGWGRGRTFRKVPDGRKRSKEASFSLRSGASGVHLALRSWFREGLTEGVSPCLLGALLLISCESPEAGALPCSSSVPNPQYVWARSGSPPLSVQIEPLLSTQLRSLSESWAFLPFLLLQHIWKSGCIDFFVRVILVFFLYCCKLFFSDYKSNTMFIIKRQRISPPRDDQRW